MKELIVKLNRDFAELESIDTRLRIGDEINTLINSFGGTQDKSHIEKLNEEKKQILDTMLSTSSQITKLLYDGI